MNILFYVTNNPQSLIGGIERISYRLASSLSARKNNVFFMYTHKHKNYLDNLSIQGELFISEEEILCRSNEIVAFIKEKKINIIIVQNVLANKDLLSVLKHETSCRILYVLHNLPFFEKKWVNFKEHIMPSIKNFKEKKYIYQYFQTIKRKISYKINWDKTIEADYEYRYKNCDKFVLLSYSFKDLLIKGIKVYNKDKISAIPNMLSYDDFLDCNQLPQKGNVVLIVSRMDEPQKRILKALSIWKRIESIHEYDEWSLEIVGEGPDLERYKEYALKNMSRVKFFGNQEPKDYFKRSSIFLMTSAHEGWGITLTEAQQFGCVPIVMNTYSAAKDIITNKENGFLVDYEWQFIRRLKQLMRDSDMRFRMAKNAIESSHRFEKDRITDMWIDLFKSL